MTSSSLAHDHDGGNHYYDFTSSKRAKKWVHKNFGELTGFSHYGGSGKKVGKHMFIHPYAVTSENNIFVFVYSPNTVRVIVVKRKPAR